MLVEADADTLTPDERARVARALAMALNPHRQRIARVSLRSGSAAGSAEEARVRLKIELRPAGVLTVSTRAPGSLSAARRAIRRAPSAVARRLAAERRQLLELGMLAAEAGGAPAFPRPPLPRAPGRAPGHGGRDTRIPSPTSRRSDGPR